MLSSNIEDQVDFKAKRSELWNEEVERRRTKIRREKKWWESLSENVRTQYGEKYVALHCKEVVDSDQDLSRLSARVRERYGSKVVAITLASRPPEFKFYI